MAFKPEGFSKKIFKERYALTSEESWEKACQRVARQMAVAENPDKIIKYEKKFHEQLITNKFVPGGRIWYNSGRPNPQLLNCFVLTDQLDSKEGWGTISHDMIVTSMTGGGCGIDFSDVRPRDAAITGQRGTAPGAVELMKMVNNNGCSIRAGGVRRVALMFSLDITHPDVIEFLDAKLNDGTLANANISLRCKDTTRFIEAVRQDKDWTLSWKGKYKRIVKAKDLWDRIVTNSYNKAEPGFLNWELIESESPISYIENLVTTNPCGEIALESNSSCCLGHLVLSRFVKRSKIDWESLGESIRLGVRFLDNVLTVNHYPLPKMKIQSQKNRRIGLGTTALADTLAILGINYGSEEGNKFVDKLYRFISKQAYDASILLAVEKGMFEACKPDQHIKTGYVKRMTPKIKALIAEHGIRNCALLTIAPTGTVSILSGNCSSGIEPMFSYAYERNYWSDIKRKTELVFHPLFTEYMRDNKDVSHFVASHELSVREHMEIQKTIQKHVDNAISKTINIPKDYPIKDMSDIWLEYLPHLKGTTFYRAGSRTALDKDGNALASPLVPLEMEEAKKRFISNESIDHEVSEEDAVFDCPNGLCEL